MEVSTKEPFQIIYSLFEHEYLGYLIESFAVQNDAQGRLTLKHQNISHKNANEFKSALDDNDYEAIKLIDKIQQDAIINRFCNKKISSTDFFLKYYKKDENLKNAIDEYIEARKAEILPLLKGKSVFEMGHDGEPTWKAVEVLQDKASVLFHFRRNEDNTHYFPTIKYHNEKVDFQYRNGIIICNNPAWLLLDNKLYSFEKEVDGKKLKPFLNKKFIVIPKKVEDTYFRKFVASLVANFDVFAKGFSINVEKYQAVPYLTFTEVGGKEESYSLFQESANGQEQAVKETKEDLDAKIVLDLQFKYGDYFFKAGEFQTSSVKVEKEGDDYTFHKIKRNPTWENGKIGFLRSLGIEMKNGRTVLSKQAAFTWLGRYKEQLEEQGFEVTQSKENSKQYFLGTSSINLEVYESNDWFDIYAKVKFGEYEIPFVQLRDIIMEGRREFKLPNGEIAVIPEEWLTQYSELFSFSESQNKEEDCLKLQKYHVALVEDLKEGNLAKVSMNEKLSQLREFDSIEDEPLPETFNGNLRPYQKAGYNWLQFLSKYNFGGCLADDMGLGKTIQTLAFLQSQKEKGYSSANLLVMPTSLIYNWQKEAEKFAPDLRLFIYTGTNREKNAEQFNGYDLVLTSYGIVRRDYEMLRDYYFNYIILDESQAIKNPEANVSKAVKELHSRNKLVLTGTPIENSTLDLWSQLSFVNPGLLGDKNFFRMEFLNPIEKQRDEKKTERLHTITKPFILRRKKDQVVTELPEKVDMVTYSEMNEEQKKFYEEIKSYYRNQILDTVKEKGVKGSQITILQGLTKLRLAANHPALVDESYEGESGKTEDIYHMVNELISKENHKILVFSQFVKHLNLFRTYLEQAGISFAYMDGSTKERQKEVEKFQENDDVRVFLVSLKSGGLGLNLTAADYVFMLDPWWNPAVEAQAVDRAHRIGQTRKVFNYKFITRDTVEEKILNLQKSKQQLASDLITTEESFVKSLTQEDISSLLD